MCVCECVWIKFHQRKVSPGLGGVGVHFSVRVAFN